MGKRRTFCRKCPCYLVLCCLCGGQHRRAHTSWDWRSRRGTESTWATASQTSRDGAWLEPTARALQSELGSCRLPERYPQRPRPGPSLSPSPPLTPAPSLAVGKTVAHLSPNTNSLSSSPRSVPVRSSEVEPWVTTKHITGRAR